MIRRDAAEVPASVPSALPLAARLREILGYASHKAREVQLAQVAASLTYSTVLALVPLLAVALALFTAFPAFGEFRDALEHTGLKGLLPEPFAGTILRYLTEFAGKAARVGALGLGALALTALSVILTVDRVLNDIWEVHQRRRLLHRLLVYWALLTLGPLLVGASLTLSSYVASMSAGFVREWPDGARHLLAAAPPALGALAYSTMYALVPNRRVAWHDAVAGGVVAAVVDEGLTRGFGAFVLHGNVLTIYGALAVLPVFLIWIYLSWLSFLFGAAIAATLPQLRRGGFADRARVGDRFVTAVALLRLLLQARDTATPERSTEELARRLRRHEEDVAALLSELERLGYVRQLAQPAAVSPRWMYAGDPAQATLAPLFGRLAVDPANSLLARPEIGIVAWLRPGYGAAWLHTPLASLEAVATSNGDRTPPAPPVTAAGARPGPG